MNNQEDSKVAEINNMSGRTPSVGNTLREAREQLGMSVNDVANRIKFAPRQIESLEADDYVRLPEAAFVRGFVRSYARLLELDPVALLASLPTTHVTPASAQSVKSVDVPMPTAFTARKHNVIWLAAALVVALSLAIFDRVHDRSTVANKAVVKNAVEPLELPKVATDGTTDPLTAPSSENTVLDNAASENSGDERAVSPAEKVADTRKSASKPVESVVQVSETKPAKPKQGAVKAEVGAAKQAISRQPELQAAVRVSPAVTTLAPKTSAPQAVASAPAHGRPTPAVDAQPKENIEVSATEHALRIELDEDAWVEVKDGSDKLLISKMHRAGSLIRVAGKAPMLVTLGNARAVRLFDNGKKIKLEKYTTAEVAKVKLK